MKKRMITILLAITLLVSQVAAFPLIASAANTWVYDTNEPGGGYWIDENGYRVDDSTPAPAPQVEMPKEEGTKEPSYTKEEQQNYASRTNASPQEFNYSEYTGVGDAKEADKATATRGSITGEISTVSTALMFSVTTDGGDVSFRFQEGTPNYTYVKKDDLHGTLYVYDPFNRYTVVLLGTGGKTLGIAASNNTHYYDVYYNVNNETVGPMPLGNTHTGTVALGESSKYYDAPQSYYHNGKEYILASAQTQYMTYGKLSYVFNYTEYDPQPKTAYIKFLDDNGTEIKKMEEFTLTVDNPTATYSMPAFLTLTDGKIYDATFTVPTNCYMNYYDTEMEHQYVYTLRTESEDPYTVTATYKGVGNDGKEYTIGANFYTIYRSDITKKKKEGTNVTFQNPATISYFDQASQTMMYFELNDSATKEWDPAADDSRNNPTFEVKYKLVDGHAPDAKKKWQIQCVDVSSGKPIGDPIDNPSYEITVEKGAYHKALSVITYDKSKYYLNNEWNSGKEMFEKQYYDGTGDTQYIYYSKEGTPEKTSYPITIKAIAIQRANPSGTGMISTTEAQISSKTETITYDGGPLTIDMPKTQTINGTEYVLVNGQQSTLTHTYYTPRRNYTFYYRDANDPQLEEYTIQEVVIGTTVSSGGGNAAVTGTGQTTTVITDGNGNIQMRDEAGNELQVLAQKKLEDDKVPLANVKGNNLLSSKGTLLLGAAIVLFGILIALMFFRKKKETDEGGKS